MDVQILDARSYFDVILYTTKSVLDKNGFMDRPTRDESGQNPTQGLFWQTWSDRPKQFFKYPRVYVIPPLIYIELTENKNKI